MALLWLPDDIARILVALASAGEAHGHEYREALRDVALAFGLRSTQCLRSGQAASEAVTELDISSVWVCKERKER